MHTRHQEVNIGDRVEDRCTGEPGVVKELKDYGAYGKEAQVLFDGTQTTIGVDTQLLKKI